MSRNDGYNDGWQDGYWAGSGSAYDRGYEEGVQAERDRIKRACDGSNSLPTSESSTLGSMIGGSIILTIFGWFWVGLIIFLFWIGGCSGEWWFPWIWRIAFWAGVGFIVLMSIGGVVMTAMEEYEAKHTPEKPADDPDMPWHKKYPPADVIEAQKKK